MDVACFALIGWLGISLGVGSGVDLTALGGWGGTFDRQLGQDSQRGMGEFGVCLAACLVWGATA